MLRNMMMLTTAIAFVVPMALSQPSAARPLATPAQPAEWCWGDCDSDHDGDGDGGSVDIEIDLKICIEAKFDHRANVESCEVLQGRACLARCTPEAVAASCALDLADGMSPRALASCEDERLDTCREQCFSGGAGFCEVRGGFPGGGNPPAWGHCKHAGDGPHQGQEANGNGHKWFDRPWCNMKGKDDGKDHGDGKHDDHGDGDGGFVFVDIEICLDLDIDIEVEG